VKGFLARRLIHLLATVSFASIFVWGIIYVLPGDPARVVMGQNATRRSMLSASVWDSIGRSTCSTQSGWEACFEATWVNRSRAVSQ
jgi:ABC-type dipeptide/oligopeptide/nickel transport system permease component